jgi:hypothetical protein
MGLCLNNCPTHKGWVYHFPHTWKMETKRIIKITNPKTILKKPKENKKKPTIFLKRFSKITKKNLNLNLKNTKNKRNKKN